MEISDGVYFYPSHLTKGLLASVIAVLAGVYAIREFTLIGTEEQFETILQLPK